jgi:hypothetical protein
VRFLAIFVKLTLQTNKKNGFEEAVVSALRLVRCFASFFSFG